MKTVETNTYRFIRDFIDRHQYAPIYDQIVHGVGLSSKSKVGPILKVLHGRGLIVWTPGKKQAIELVALKSLPSLETDLARLIRLYGFKAVGDEYNRQVMAHRAAKARAAEGRGA